MLNPILLTLGMLSALGGQPSPGPPLCRVQAASITTAIPLLRRVDVRLRADCPTNGHAWVRLRSLGGATDPVYGWVELTAAFPSKTFLGVLPNWFADWEAASGVAYRVPER